MHIFGHKQDFEGSELHRHFKAHASCVTTSTEIKTTDGPTYLYRLQTDEHRMQRFSVGAKFQS